MIKLIHIDNIRQGPALRESLTDHQTDRIRAVYRRLHGTPLTRSMPFEIFETGFLSDIRPEREISIWEAIAETIEIAEPKAEEHDEVSRLALWLTTTTSEPVPKAWSLSKRVIARVVDAWHTARLREGITGSTLIKVMARDGSVEIVEIP